jgi:hypothetical protein
MEPAERLLIPPPSPGEDLEPRVLGPGDPAGYGAAEHGNLEAPDPLPGLALPLLRGTAVLARKGALVLAAEGWEVRGGDVWELAQNARGAGNGRVLDSWALALEMGLALLGPRRALWMARDLQAGRTGPAEDAGRAVIEDIAAAWLPGAGGAWLGGLLMHVLRTLGMAPASLWAAGPEVVGHPGRVPGGGRELAWPASEEEAEAFEAAAFGGAGPLLITGARTGDLGSKAAPLAALIVEDRPPPRIRFRASAGRKPHERAAAEVLAPGQGSREGVPALVAGAWGRDDVPARLPPKALIQVYQWDPAAIRALVSRTTGRPEIYWTPPADA